MSEFRPFDLGAAQGKGIQNAMSMMQTMGAANELKQQNTMRDLRQQSSSTGEDLAFLASKAGYPEIANKIQMQRVNKGVGILKFITGSAPLIKDQSSLDNFLSQAYGMGAPKGSYPTEWNPKTQKYFAGLTKKAKKEIIKLSPGGRAFTTSGEEIARVPMTPRQRGKGKAAGTTGERLNLARRKLVKKSVVELFGGFYNPISGRISGLSKDAHKKMAVITKRAIDIMRKDPSLSEQDAANQAAREGGIKEMPALGATESTRRRMYNPATGGLD